MIEPWYDLKTSLAKELGETLIHWSHNGVSTPMFYSEDEWSSELYMHGCALLRYGDNRYRSGDYIVNNGWISDEDDVTAAEAKYAMMFIYTNFYDLWD